MIVALSNQRRKLIDMRQKILNANPKAADSKGIERINIRIKKIDLILEDKK
jgi:hypothetical protein